MSFFSWNKHHSREWLLIFLPFFLTISTLPEAVWSLSVILLITWTHRGELGRKEKLICSIVSWYKGEKQGASSLPAQKKNKAHGGKEYKSQRNFVRMEGKERKLIMTFPYKGMRGDEDGKQKLVVIVVVWYFQDCEQGTTSWAGMREAGKGVTGRWHSGGNVLSHRMSCYKFWLFFPPLNCQLHLDVSFLVFLSRAVPFHLFHSTFPTFYRTLDSPGMKVIDTPNVSSWVECLFPFCFQVLILFTETASQPKAHALWQHPTEKEITLQAITRLFKTKNLFTNSR